MSPRTSTQNEIIRRQRTAEIRETALELFAHKGFVNTSISDIAKTAGISKGLMYNYFPSKDHLLEAILKNAIVVGNTVMDKIADHSIPAPQRLQDLVASTLHLYKTNLSFFKLLHSLSLQEETMEKFADLMGQYQVYKMDLSIALFKELGSKNPQLEALQLGAQLGGILIHYMHMKEQYPMEEMKDLVLKTFLRER